MITREQIRETLLKLFEAETGEPLDSMGGPVRVDLDGRVVFVCCKSCEKPLRKTPAEYLAKLPK